MRILIPFFLLLSLHSSSQTLEGYYTIQKREPRGGAKEVFQFRSDSTFKYQAHSNALVLIGEGVIRKLNDTLALYFTDCNTCLADSGTVSKRSNAPKNWIFLKKLMPSEIDVWGVRDEVMAFTVRNGEGNQVVFTDDNSVTTYRRVSGKEVDILKKSFERFFK